MKNLLAQEWEPLPDGLLVMRANIFAPKIAASASSLREGIASQYFSKCSGEEAFDLILLSKTGPPLGWVCKVHGHIKNSRVVSLQMALHRKPRQRVPKKVSEASGAQRGFPNGFVDFTECLKNPKATCRVGVQGFLIPDHRPLRIEGPKIASLGSLALAETTMRFERKKLDSRVEIEFSKSHRPHFNASATIPLVIDANCFDFAAEKLSGVFKSIFKTDADNP